MTIGTCIAKVDLLRPNAISEGEKIAWCWELEAQLKHEFYPRYADNTSAGEETPAEVSPSRETVLSGSGPYEEMYVHYLAGKIDLASQETDAYGIDAALFREALDSFRKDYHRNHTPK